RALRRGRARRARVGRRPRRRLDRGLRHVDAARRARGRGSPRRDVLRLPRGGGLVCAGARGGLARRVLPGGRGDAHRARRGREHGAGPHPQILRGAQRDPLRAPPRERRAAGEARGLPRRHPPVRARAPLDARHRGRGVAQAARHPRCARAPPATLRGAGAQVSSARRADAPLAAGLVVAAYAAALRPYGIFDYVDEGLLLVQALRAARGQVPYVDFHTGYGPLYFRLQAWLLAAGGWDAIRWALVAVQGAAGALLFVLARRLAGPALAWAAVALEVAFFLPVAPGRGAPFNAPYPAWYAGLAGVALAVPLAAGFVAVAGAAFAPALAALGPGGLAREIGAGVAGLYALPFPWPAGVAAAAGLAVFAVRSRGVGALALVALALAVGAGVAGAGAPLPALRLGAE